MDSVKTVLPKGTILYKYLFSYAAVLLIPLIVFIYVINTNILSEFQEQVLKANKDNLERVREQTEQKFLEMERIAMSISDNQRLSPFMVKQNYYKAYQGMVELRNYKYANDFIYDVLFYIRGDDRIYSASHSTNIKFMTEFLYPFENWGYEQFYMDINNIERPFVRPSERIKVQQANLIETVVYIYPIRPYQPYASVIFLIDNQKIREMLGSILKEYNENVFILNKENNIISSLKREDTITEQKFDFMLQQLKDHRSDTFMLPGNEYLVTYVVSQTSGWTYASVVRNDLIMARVNNIKNTIYYAIFIIFVIGAIVITAATYINYNPIYRLMKKIMGKYSIDNQGKNEVEAVEMVFDKVWSLNEKLNKEMQLYKPVLRQYILKELIKGNIYNMNEIIEIPAGLELSQPNQGFYLVVIFKIWDTQVDVNYSLIFKLIHKITEDHTDNRFKIFSIDNMAEEQLIMVLSVYSENDKEIKQDIKFMIEKLHNTFATEWNIKPIIGVGNAYNDILSIGKSFTEAEKASQLYVIEKDKNIFYFDEVDNKEINDNQGYSYPYDELKKLSIQIKNGQSNNVNNTLKGLMGSLVKREYPEFISRCIVYDIYNMYIKRAMEMNIDLQLITSQYIDEFTSKEQASLERLFSVLETASEVLCNHVILQQLNEKGLLDQMVEYINGKCTDYDFSVEILAEYLNMSANYLSQFFKEKTGDTISNYLWRLRIEKVKELLVTSEQPIKEIVNRVGYVDVSSFSRKFKNTEGITPGVYRKQHSISKES